MRTRKKFGWKFLVGYLDRKKKSIRSRFDRSEWSIGKWRRVKKPKDSCVGLNCSDKIYQAARFVAEDVLAKVEYKGKIISSKDKHTCEYMRIVKAWKVPWNVWETYRARCHVWQDIFNSMAADSALRLSYDEYNKAERKLRFNLLKKRERFWRNRLPKFKRIKKRRRRTGRKIKKGAK